MDDIIISGFKCQPDIVVRLSHRKIKTKILRETHNLKGTNIYINEHLTTSNAAIAREARMLKRQNRIAATWIRNCKVFVKTVGSPENARVRIIRSLEDLHRIVNH